MVDFENTWMSRKWKGEIQYKGNMMKSTKTVLAVGVTTMDCLFELDQFPIPDEKIKAKNFKLEGGGNAANTVVALSRLGCKAKILSRVGDDLFGLQCIKLFQAEGVDTSLLQVDGIATPFSVVLVDLAQFTRTIIHYSKPPCIDYVFNPSHLEGVDYVYLDGRNIDSYAKLIAEASNRSISIAIETERKTLNCSAYFPFANIVFASRQFHKEYFGNQNYESNLDEILAQGPEIAVTTLGPEGVIVKTNECCIRENAIKLTPRDTTGAGDAFNAAFLYCLMHQLSLQEATEFATQYAAECCTKLGSREGLLKE